MPTLPHVHGRECDRAVRAMWDRFFLPLVDPQFLDSRSPFLAWPVHLYFTQLVLPQIACARLRAWLLVALAAPDFDRRVTLRFGGPLILRLADDLQTWWNAGLLTTRWFAVGAPALIDAANARGLYYLDLQQ